MSLGSSSSLILTIITMSIWCEFMAAHPQHSSFYPLASNSSSSCSSLSSCTFPGLTQIYSFLFTITTFSLYSPALTQVPLAARDPPCSEEGSSFDAQKTASPSSSPLLFPTLPFQPGRGLLGATHADINTSSSQIFPDALLQRMLQNFGSRSRQAGDEKALSLFLLLAARFLLCPSTYLYCQLTSQMNQQPHV